MTETLDRIRGALVGLKMPRAREALDHTMQLIQKDSLTTTHFTTGKVFFVHFLSPKSSSI